MKKISLMLTAISGFLLLTSCSSHEPDPIGQSQQERYAYAVKIQKLTQAVKDLGMAVYAQGDDYQIIIPSSFIFINNTPQLSNESKPVFQAIIKLINAQHTPSVRIETYANVLRKPALTPADPQWNFSLSRSWADTMRDQLQQQGLKVGLLYTSAKGACDNTGAYNRYSNRIEIHYRIDHET